MATFIAVDFSESPLLQQNRNQVQANRLNALEDRERRQLGDRIVAARQGQERTPRGRLRRGRREELAAARVARPVTEIEVNEVYQNKSEGWTLLLCQDVGCHWEQATRLESSNFVLVNNDIGYYHTTPLSSEEYQELTSYKVVAWPEGSTQEQIDQAYADMRQLLVDEFGGTSFESRTRILVSQSDGAPYTTSYYQATASGLLAAQTFAKKNRITVNSLITVSTEYPSIPDTGQRLKLGGNDYLIADASLAGVSSYKITLDHGLVSSAPAGSPVLTGYTVIVQHSNIQLYWFNITTNQLEGVFQP